jgi:hypothetical protein
MDEILLEWLTDARVRLGSSSREIFALLRFDLVANRAHKLLWQKRK